MSQLNRVINLFEEFETLSKKMICLDEKNKKELKLRIFKNVFQIIKIGNFEIHFKKKEIEI